MATITARIQILTALGTQSQSSIFTGALFRHRDTKRSAVITTASTVKTQEVAMNDAGVLFRGACWALVCSEVGETMDMFDIVCATLGCQLPYHSNICAQDRGVAGPRRAP